MKKSVKKSNVHYLTQLALLSAIIIIMAFTPLGYLKVGIVEITFLVIPVAVGSIILGPKGGAILGGLFGLTSFIQCFGMSAFGAMLLSINPIATFISCIIPRICIGLFTGWIFQALHHSQKTTKISFMFASISAPIINTILYIAFFALCFKGVVNDMALEAGTTFFGAIIAMVSLNSVVEIMVCLVVATAISKSIYRFVRI